MSHYPPAQYPPKVSCLAQSKTLGPSHDLQFCMIQLPLANSLTLCGTYYSHVSRSPQSSHLAVNGTVNTQPNVFALVVPSVWSPTYPHGALPPPLSGFYSNVTYQRCLPNPLPPDKQHPSSNVSCRSLLILFYFSSWQGHYMSLLFMSASPRPTSIPIEHTFLERTMFMFVFMLHLQFLKECQEFSMCSTVFVSELIYII